MVPSVLALAVMSAAFTGLAIGTGFERKYAVLKRLGATALPRSVLLLGKTCAVLILELVQAVLICAFGAGARLAPARRPRLWAVLLIVLGTAAFGGLGLLLAGTLRAEVTLAAANLIWLVLLFAGGIAIPLSKLPGRRGRGRAALPALGGAVRRPAPGAAGRRRAAGASGC